MPMNNQPGVFSQIINRAWNAIGLKMRTKLITLFLCVAVIPLVMLTVFAWRQFVTLNSQLAETAMEDAAAALNNIATENIERMTTDTARIVADFLYARDADIRYLAAIEPSEQNYRHFIEAKLRRLVRKTGWDLTPDRKSWEAGDEKEPGRSGGISSNTENNDMDGFHYRKPGPFNYNAVPLYDEITFIDLDGNEIVKVVSDSSTKINYPLNAAKRNVSFRENTYVKAETYFSKLQQLKPGEIYVSNVIGAYVGSNYIGMYVPDAVASAAQALGYDIEYDPENQAFAGNENPNGRRFEGIVRWASPVLDDAPHGDAPHGDAHDGKITGYVTFALNHDHIMEFVDHITPMDDRYTELPSAYDGNYAFIWDYQCRSICHPRHHSIVGFDPETGDPQIPWLESSIYDAWQESGIEKWTDFIAGWPLFDNQSRKKIPSPSLTRAGLVGLDGRYLNNAPQCTGWMDLSMDGGSGSFYILWSGLYKLTTAAAIPYYTGEYAPSAANNYSRRGFGVVTIGAGLGDFTHPVSEIGERLHFTMQRSLRETLRQSFLTSVIALILVVLIAIQIASFLTKNITGLINGVSRFRAGERQFRFNAPIKDEFGTLADAFDAMADNITNSESGALVITGMDKRIIYINELGLELCKKTLPQVKGMLYSDVSIYPAHTKYCPLAALERGVESEALYDKTSKKYFRGHANYFLDTNGNRIGYIISSTDVTEIQTAKEAADRANRAKGDFLSNMSHEIRTPLNAIIGMTAIGMSADDSGKKDYCMEKINDASQHLLGVINDILDMSKIEANKLELSPLKFNFEKMLQRVTNVVGFKVEEKQQSLNVNIDNDIPLMIICDEQRLVQVITNLLSNAVKFTPDRGLIGLDCKLVEKAGTRCTIQVDVTDTGIGISKDQMPRLFKLFEQAERSTSRKFGGTGLGLAISKSIVEMMNGKIWVKSEAGKGSTFSFTVQAEYGAETRESLMPPERKEIHTEDEVQNFKGRQILLAEDVEINREIVIALLEPAGLEIDCAENGAEAVKLFTENPLRYDIIFMDLQMPEVDGLEATRRIRALDIPRAKTIPIIAMTANVFKEDVENCLAAGMNEHIGKPLNLNEVFGKLRDFLPGPAAGKK
jgi:signal transduction histidine kinase/CheY-like chemotaxis protein